MSHFLASSSCIPFLCLGISTLPTHASVKQNSEPLGQPPGNEHTLRPRVCPSDASLPGFDVAASERRSGHCVTHPRGRRRAAVGRLLAAFVPAESVVQAAQSGPWSGGGAPLLDGPALWVQCCSWSWPPCLQWLEGVLLFPCQNPDCVHHSVCIISFTSPSNPVR